MRSAKTTFEYILIWLADLPGWLKNGIVLTGLIVGFIVSFRSDKYLYSVVIISLIFCYAIGFSLYILLKRDPSPFGGRGAYKYYMFRSFAKVLLGVILLSAIVLLSFSKNRDYVRSAFDGTPTIAIPSSTLISPNKLVEISSQWLRGCENHYVLLDNSELPKAQEAFYELSKGNIEKYTELQEKVGSLNGYSFTEFQPDKKWEHTGLLLLLSGNPNIIGDVILKNEVKITANYSQAHDMVNVLMPLMPGCGGGGSAYTFPPINLSPGMNVFSTSREFDYFSIAPSENIFFSFRFVCDAPGIYNLQFSIPYTYQGNTGIYAYLESKSIICPEVFSIYEYWVDGHFQRSPHSPNYDIDSLPSDESFGKLTKTGEYHMTEEGEFIESLDWLPTNSIPPLPFWRMTVFDNANFEGEPTYIGNIKIENHRLDVYIITFFANDFGSGVIPSDSDYSVILESEQHFFGGKYSISVDDFHGYEFFYGNQSGEVQISIDGNAVTPYFKMSENDIAPSFYISNGNHVVSVKYKNNKPVKDSYFAVFFEHEGE